MMSAILVAVTTHKQSKQYHLLSYILQSHIQVHMNHCNDIEAPDAFASSARSSASLRTDFLEELSVLNFRELSEKTEKNMAPT